MATITLVAAAGRPHVTHELGTHIHGELGLLEDMGNEVASVDIDRVSCELEDDLQNTVDDSDNKVQSGKLVKSQASILPIPKTIPRAT